MFHRPDTRAPALKNPDPPPAPVLKKPEDGAVVWLRKPGPDWKSMMVTSTASVVPVTVASRVVGPTRIVSSPATKLSSMVIGTVWSMFSAGRV